MLKHLRVFNLMNVGQLYMDCIQMIKIARRLELCKAINVNGPGQRYEFDLTYLNDDLAEAFDVKYLLGIRCI